MIAMARVKAQSETASVSRRPRGDAAAVAPEALVGMMTSLAEPTRLRLMKLLEKQELGVAELCEILQMPQSTVSRHLKLLAGEGWLTSRRHGTTNLYRMILDELAQASRDLWTLVRDRTAGSAAFRQDELRLARLLQRRRQDGDDFFAAAAADWDRLRVDYYGPNVTEAALLGLLPSHWTVADLGCGTGQVAAALAPCVARVIGVDRSAEMLEAAAARTRELANVELRPGDLESLPLDDACCDAAVMVLVLAYLSDPAPALSEASRILRPGGRLVILDLLRHDRDDFRRLMGQVAAGFDPADLSCLLTDAGFTRIRGRPLPPEPEARGPALLVTVAQRPDASPPATPHDATRASRKERT